MKRLGTMLGLALGGSLLFFTGCRDEGHRTQHQPVEAPVSAATSIPDAPVNGTIHGLQFALHDARYIVDPRVGYAHTDIRLSAGTSETPCGPIEPAKATSVWLRLEGEAIKGAKEVRLAPDSEGPWSVHYQFHDGEKWNGIGEGAALVNIREAGPDGRLSGGIAVCFSDDLKSCVTGSFNAVSCPINLDQPVRGAVPVEAIPPGYRLKMLTPPDAGALDAGALLDAGFALDAAAPRH